MGAYLDRLNEQFDEIKRGIDTLVDRAADESRDVTDDEQKQVDRDQSRLDDLTKAIEHYTSIDTTADKVNALRASVGRAPVQTRTKAEPEVYDVAREFPTTGDYALMVHRATFLKDPAAIEALNRATQHQTTADNPGIIPRPVMAPVINLIDAGRPFINSITRRPLPAGSFDRPKITAHVAVGVQAAEKDPTASQKLVIGKLPVSAKTWAGHLNISRQDIKWSNPGIMSIVFDDFAAVYANETDNDACDGFGLSIAASTPVDTLDGAGLTAAFFGAAGTILSATNQMPDTVWMAVDVWGSLGGVVDGQGRPLFSSLSPDSTAGNVMGLKTVVDSHFPAGFLAMGPSKFAEYYEDVDGLMQVGEPDVLGQLVGYAGFAAFLNTAPEAFTKLTLPAVGP